MLDAGRNALTSARPAPRDALSYDASRWKRLAAITATLALSYACGGRAQDTEEGDIDTDVGAGAAGGTSTARPGRNPASPGRQQQAPRDGEICYSPASIASTPGLGSLASFLPQDAFDDNGCVSSEYSLWIDGGGCNYDSRPAVVRGDQCCHLLDASMPGCG